MTPDNGGDVCGPATRPSVSVRIEGCNKRISSADKPTVGISTEKERSMGLQLLAITAGGDVVPTVCMHATSTTEQTSILSYFPDPLSAGTPPHPPASPQHLHIHTHTISWEPSTSETEANTLRRALPSSAEPAAETCYRREVGELLRNNNPENNLALEGWKGKHTSHITHHNGKDVHRQVATRHGAVSVVADNAAHHAYEGP